MVPYQVHAPLSPVALDVDIHPSNTHKDMMVISGAWIKADENRWNPLTIFVSTFDHRKRNRDQDSREWERKWDMWEQTNSDRNRKLKLGS